MPRDHIREFYESGGYIKPRNRKAEALSRVRDGYAGGGKAIQKAARLFQDYADPAAKLIGDWTWRPLQDVAKDLKITGPSNFSPEVQNYGDFMRKMAARASGEGLSPEDLMKSYAITRSSMGRSAINPGKLIDAGLDVPPGEMIRPEGAMAYWLRSPAGRQYLEEAAHTGQVDPKISQGLTSLMTPFGKQNEYPDILNWGAQNLPGREGRTSELVARASQDASSPGEWLDLMANTRGIKPAKQGFWSSLMGRGDMPTFDARQIILNTGLSSAEGAARATHPAKAAEAVQRLRSRMEGLDYQGPDWMQPFYPHLAHHETWDRSAGEATTHQDLIDTMLARATGGRVGYDVGGAIRKGARGAAKLAKEVPPVFENLVDRTARVTGYARDEVVKMLERTKEGVKGATETKPGVSSRMGTTPFEGSTAAYTDAPYTPIIKRTLTPESFPEGSWIVGSMVDNTAAGPTVHGVDNVRFDRPVGLTGGNDFPYTQPPGQLWAAAPGPLTGLSSALRSAGAHADDPVYFTTKLMNPSGSDQSHMSISMIDQMLRNAEMPQANVDSFNDYVRRYKSSVKVLDEITGKPKSQNVEVLKDFPGMQSNELHDYLMSLPMIKRAPLLQAMDTKFAQDLGVPSSVSARFAATDPALIGKPRGTVGRTVGGFDLGTDLVTDPEYPHGSYPVNLPGTMIGGFDRPVPGDVLFRDRWDLLRSKYRPQDQMNTFMNFPAVQKVTPEWLDKSMKDYEKIQRGWTPSGLAEGGRVGYSVGGAAKKTAQALKNVIRAWHGSPHDFDKFDASKIGTGQGAQTFGVGHYFAENPDVARGYRTDLAAPQHRLTIDGKPVDIDPGGGRGSENAMLQRLLKSAQQNYADNNLTSLKEFGTEPVEHAWAGVNKDPRLQEMFERLKQSEIGFQPGGKLYEANINADPKSFLDWDKPLVDQGVWDRIHPNVRDAVDSAVEDRGWNPFSGALEDYKGHELFQALRHHDVHDVLPPKLPGSDWMGDTNPHKHTSAYLESLGLPGIRYLDQFSRPTGEGTRNYVVFPGSSDLIDIVSKRAKGGSVGYADGGEVTPAIGVEGIKGLINIIKKASGLKQARRFEDAADVANLKPYSEQALLDTFNRPTSMYGAFKPSEFERYAYPLDVEGHTISMKENPGINLTRGYVADGAPQGTHTYDDYMKYLQGIAQGQGFSKVPELGIGWRGRGETPAITAHDGRHRMRALRGMGDEPSLVELKPDAVQYRGLTVPRLPTVLKYGEVTPQNPMGRFDTVDLPDELFAFGGSV